MVKLGLKVILTRDGLPSVCDGHANSNGIVPRETRGLSQPEKAGNEHHYYNYTNYVENIVHVSFSFLSRKRIYTINEHVVCQTLW